MHSGAKAALEPVGEAPVRERGAPRSPRCCSETRPASPDRSPRCSRGVRISPPLRLAQLTRSRTRGASYRGQRFDVVCYSFSYLLRSFRVALRADISHVLPLRSAYETTSRLCL